MARGQVKGIYQAVLHLLKLVFTFLKLEFQYSYLTVLT